jgi:hypothetical protein
VSRKRVPVAELGEDDYRIVRHTHDVEEASSLMRALLGDCTERGCTDTCPPCPPVKLGTPRRVHVRILSRLPGSLAEAEGWAFEYRECQPGRGAFPAVVFR